MHRFSVRASNRKSFPQCNSICAHWLAISGIACAAACPLEKTNFPFTAIKKSGLSAKCLRHATGPSCVTSCATVAVNRRTLSSTAARRAGVNDREWPKEWRHPGNHGSQREKKDPPSHSTIPRGWGTRAGSPLRAAKNRQLSSRDDGVGAGEGVCGTAEAVP